MQDRHRSRVEESSVRVQVLLMLLCLCLLLQVVVVCVGVLLLVVEAAVGGLGIVRCLVVKHGRRRGSRLKRKV